MMARYAVKMPQEIYFVAHQDYDNWSPARFSPADIKYYHHDLVEQLGAVNADLLAALREIAKCEGAFSPHQLTFANNTIENMKEIAEIAIAKAEVTG